MPKTTINDIAVILAGMKGEITAIKDKLEDDRKVLSNHMANEEIGMEKLSNKMDKKVDWKVFALIVFINAGIFGYFAVQLDHIQGLLTLYDINAS